MNSINKIAIYDIGVGGLTFLHECRQKMPSENYLFLNDSANAPYIDKSLPEIIDMTHEALRPLEGLNDIKALVIASHELSDIMLPVLEDHYSFPVIGMEYAMSTEEARSRVNSFTLSSPCFVNSYSDAAIKGNKVKNTSQCDAGDLINYAEEFDFSSPSLRRYLRHIIGSVNWDDYDTLILACTYYVYFRPHMTDFLPSHVKIVDSNKNTALKLRSLITPAPGMTLGNLECIISGTKIDSEIIMPYLNTLKRGPLQGYSAFN